MMSHSKDHLNHQSGKVYASKEKEEERIKELYELNLLYSEYEESFDRITKLAREIMGVPTSIISFINENEQWFKSCIGLPKRLKNLRGTKRSVSFCQHVIAHEKMIVIEDTYSNELFKDNPLVSEYGVRSYVGVPLITKKNNIIGTLCILDYEPKTFDKAMLNQLETLSYWVISEIELRQELKKEQENKNKLNQLLKQERWLKEAIESTSTAVIITDPHQEDNPIIYTNQAFNDITGYTNEEVLGRNCRFLQGPDTQQEDIARINKAINCEESIHIDIKNYKKNGVPFWNELFINPVWNDNGELINYVGIQQDITSRKNREKEMMKSFVEQENLIHNVPDIICMLDEHGYFVKWNKQLEHHTDLKENELSNKNFKSILLDIAEFDLKRYKYELLTNQYFEFDAMLTQKDKTLTSFRWRVIPTGNREQNPTGYVVTGSNISGQMDLQKSIKIAGDIQEQLLPQDRNNQYFTLKSIYYPSEFVSGDVFQYYWDDKTQKLTLFLADIMGHGVATALQSSALRTLFYHVFTEDMLLIEKIKWLNKQCVAIFPENFYSGIFGVEVDFKNMQMNYVGAGINKFVHVRGKEIYLEKAPGFFIGAFENMDYNEYSMSIEENDEFCFMTDGIYDQLDVSECKHTIEPDRIFEKVKQLALRGSNKDDSTAIHLRIRGQSKDSSLE